MEHAIDKRAAVVRTKRRSTGVYGSSRASTSCSVTDYITNSRSYYENNIYVASNVPYRPSYEIYPPSIGHTIQ